MANIVLIATGAIRAYRQLELARELLARGHAVRCLHTPRSLLFLGVYLLRNPRQMPLFFRLMHSPLAEAFSYIASGFGRRASHVVTARWADVIVVAPATCNTLGKITSGVTDNYALLVVRAFHRDRRVVLAPAMNPEMWADPFTRHNVERLKATEKYLVVDPIVAATMGSGEVGLGVLAHNEQILAGVDAALARG
jgi:phosphopantothenoylcysteine decarboxylase/phosphopantothenate--cysteine ligase